MPRLPLAGVLALLALTPSCARHVEVPALRFNPETAAKAPPLEAATIAIPVVIAIAPLKVRLDSVFPMADSLDRARCGALSRFVCHQYVYRRDSLDVRMLNDRVTMVTHLAFRARMTLPGGVGVASCGYDPEPMLHGDLRLAMNLYWREDWRLASRATVLAASILDKCEVTVLHVDATPTLKEMLDAQLARFRKQVDSIVPLIGDFKPLADSVWRVVHQPVALDSAASLWLTWLPERTNLAPVVGNGPTATTAIFLSARARVVTGSEPSRTPTPLPVLSLSRPAPGLHVPVELTLPFADLSARATALLAGEIAGQGMTVRNASVWGVGDTVVVRLNIAGRVAGELYLVGRIGYDSATRSVVINDLKYTLESANRMSSIKANLGAGRIRQALQTATGHGRLAVGEQLDRAKSQLEARLNCELAPGVRMSGTISDLRVERLYTTAEAFTLRVVIDGQAQIVVSR